MPIAQMLLPEFDQEMANTRRMLEVVPAADHGWRPHPRSMVFSMPRAVVLRG